MADSRRAPRRPLHRHDLYPGPPCSYDATPCVTNKSIVGFRISTQPYSNEAPEIKLVDLHTLSSTCATLAEDREEFVVLRNVQLLIGVEGRVVSLGACACTTTLYASLPTVTALSEGELDIHFLMDLQNECFTSAVVLTAHGDTMYPHVETKSLAWTVPTRLSMDSCLPFLSLGASKHHTTRRRALQTHPRGLARC